jgi:hypothetical protein
MYLGYDKISDRILKNRENWKCIQIYLFISGIGFVILLSLLLSPSWNISIQKYLMIIGYESIFRHFVSMLSAILFISSMFQCVLDKLYFIVSRK